MALVAAAGGGMQPEVIAAWCALAAAILTPMFTAIAASRKQQLEQEMPRLRQRLDEVEKQRDTDRQRFEREREEDRRRYGGRIDELEDEVTELRRYVYDLRQDIAASGQEPRAIPAKLRIASERRREHP